MKRSKDEVIFQFISGTAWTILAIVCILPFVIILSSSLTSERSIIQNGYNLFPKVFSTSAYRMILKNPWEILDAYGISLYTTFFGGGVSLFLTAMTGYVLSRRSFPWRKSFSFFFYFTTIFSGGLVPWYILCVQYLHLKANPLLALVLPYLFSVWNILILRNFIRSIPESIIESAKIDGAGDFYIFLRIVLSLSKPALATIGLFIALGFWNDWYLSFMFINDFHHFSLQYYLYKMISAADGIRRIASQNGTVNIVIADLPTESFKMAMTVIAIGPMIFLYPFLQKYFVRGITIGAVKG
jgi:putative aldouronate transport system permease protein